MNRWDTNIRSFAEPKFRPRFDDEGQPTATSAEQKIVELSTSKCFDRFEQLFHMNPNLPYMNRDEHIRWLERSLHSLSGSYEILDSSRPWLVYWILNALHLLHHKLNAIELGKIVKFLVKCRSPMGGFGGGPGQYPHLATTYAAVNSLCMIGTSEALEAIDRQSLRDFLWSVRDLNGSFRMHVGGEIDVRGVYCAVSVAQLANLSSDDKRLLFDKTVDWVCSCQTYEGGIGGIPDLEAHGGYAFCAVSSLALLGSTGTCDLDALLRWAVHKQMKYEGGFQGRTNKLVDACYSFWQGAIFPIVQMLMKKQDPRMGNILTRPLFHRGALQEYILICCQYPNGGLIDKPGKSPDAYHSCYALSGLSIAQHCPVDIQPLVIGDTYNNEVLPTHPLHNIPPKSVWDAFIYFQENSEDLYGTEENTETVSDDSIADSEPPNPKDSCWS